MAVTGIGSNYSVYESVYASQKNETAKKTETKKAETKETSAAQSESVKSSTSNKTSDYYSYLSKNYDCVKNGNVAISSAYLRQCANDPEKAKVLEENLSLYKEIYDHAYKSAQKAAAANGGTVTSYSMTWNVDSEGNISMIGQTTVRTETGAKSAKDIREDLTERLKEKREEAKKAENARAQKKEEQERLEKLRERAKENGQIYIKENGAGSDIENYAAAQKDKLEDAYYPKFDVGI